ncbi:MAG: hypothetical protein OXH25_00815 [Chloroflexi bacterium]|nr:hypothetical protein [Chloroflexota bacterium]
MGEIVVEIELENAGDRHLTQRGFRSASDVRRETIRANADRGVTMLMVPKDVVERLGVPEIDQVRTVSTDGQRGEAAVAGPLRIRIGVRETSTECIVLPEGAGTVVGLMVLNVLDLHPDPASQTLGQRPESPDRPLLRG